MSFTVTVRRELPDRTGSEEIYQQTVEDLDLQAVIAAVNKATVPVRRHRKKE